MIKKENMTDQKMNYDEAQEFAHRFADHAYAELGYDGWNVIVPIGAEESSILPDEFIDTPAWDAHNTIVAGSESVLQEWARNSSDFGYNSPLLVLAKAYNLEEESTARYQELYKTRMIEQKVPYTKEELATLNQITYLDYKQKRDKICYEAMQQITDEFYDRRTELFEYANPSQVSHEV